MLSRKSVDKIQVSLKSDMKTLQIYGILLNTFWAHKSSDKVAEEVKTHIYVQKFIFRKLCRLWDTVEKYGRATQVTDDVEIRRRKMHFACRKTKARIEKNT